VEYFNNLGSVIANNVICTRKIKSRIVIAKAGVNKKKILFTSKLDFRKKLVKYYSLSIALYV
jgi:hypothetical protein